MLHLSRRQDVLNVTSQPSTRADRTFWMSIPQVKFGKIGVKGFYIIMRARHERVFYYYVGSALKGYSSSKKKKKKKKKKKHLTLLYAYLKYKIQQTLPR